MKTIQFALLILLVASACSLPLALSSPTPQATPAPEVPGQTPTIAEVAPFTPTETPAPAWEVYTDEEHGFSLQHPGAWAVSANDAQSGFIGEQVFWCVVDYDPMQVHGDVPAVDQIEQTEIDGQPAVRVSGHYLGAMGDMGLQQYLGYVIQKGEVFYMFTLYALDARGVPQEMMNEPVALSENDIALFEQMMASLKFN